MNNFKRYLQSHPGIIKSFILGYIVFAGCVVFPFRNENYPFDFMRAYLVLASYGTIGLGLAGIYGGNKEKIIYLLTLVLTILGMICRYILEFGEVSNTMNFTTFNIVSYILIIPVLTVCAYHYIIKQLIKNK